MQVWFIEDELYPYYNLQDTPIEWDTDRQPVVISEVLYWNYKNAQDLFEKQRRLLREALKQCTIFY